MGKVPLTSPGSVMLAARMRALRTKNPVLFRANWTSSRRILRTGAACCATTRDRLIGDGEFDGGGGGEARAGGRGLVDDGGGGALAGGGGIGFSAEAWEAAGGRR